MKCYVKIHPRPYGAEPKIFLTKPVVVEPEIVEVEPGYFLEDPFSSIELEEFDSEFSARRFFKEFYPSAYDEIKVIE